MTDPIARLNAELKDINNRLTAVKNESLAKEKELAEAVAKTVGLSIGATIVVERNEGFGSNRKLKTRRYIVTKFSYRGYGNPPLNVYGRTLKKDGTQGELFHVWQDWKIEPGSEAR